MDWRRKLAAIVLAGALLDAAYLAAVWPDWSSIGGTGPIPKSRFIEEYEERRAAGEKLPPLRWRPVPRASIPERVGRAFVLAEDSRFYEHRGIDWAAVREATENNLERGGVAYGASTISQQTVKNLFLSRERSWLRKWHELVLTWGLERNVEKERILAIYLNVVELGEGVFGVEAAARHYFDTSAAGLTTTEAAELAATLPSPTQHNPRTRSRSFMARRERVLEFVQRFAPELVEEVVVVPPVPPTTPDTTTE